MKGPTNEPRERTISDRDGKLLKGSTPLYGHLKLYTPIAGNRYAISENSRRFNARLLPRADRENTHLAVLMYKESGVGVKASIEFGDLVAKCLR